MPTYQYACTTSACGNQFELVQKFTDPAASECPACGGPVRKVYSAVGVVFKGSGFYRTDSRTAPKERSSSGSSSASGSGSSEKSSEKSSGKSSEKSSSETSSSSSSSPAPSSTTPKAAAS